MARFRAEARHAGALSHHGIAQLHDYGEMELVDGLSLAGLLASGPLDPACVMDEVAQAAAGLGAAHLAGLVHCDIKCGAKELYCLCSRAVGWLPAAWSP